ncbi:unnamed protein product, partial [Prunus brigantina]
FDVANLAAWYSGPRGCVRTRDVLLLDAVRLCAGVPARSTVRRDGDEVLKVRYRKNKLLRERLLVLVLDPLNVALRLVFIGGLENICMVEFDRGKWVVKSAFGIVKHGGVTPINLGKSRPPP